MKNSNINFTVFFTAIFFFALTSISVSNSAKADDLDIFSASLASDPPVNVLFVFDISGSMALTPAGVPASPLDGPGSRYGILLQALNDVLFANKDKTSLNIGISWFDAYETGIQWPVSPIGGDAHAIDANIPANWKKNYEIIPYLLEKDGELKIDSRTQMVGGLSDAANYFRGGDVNQSTLRKPKLWHVGNQDYQGGSQWSPNPASYLPTAAAIAHPALPYHPPYAGPPYNATKAYARYKYLSIGSRWKCNPPAPSVSHDPLFPVHSWCYDGYNPMTSSDDPYALGVDPWHVNVRDCREEIVNHPSDATCPVLCQTTGTNSEGHPIDTCSCALVNNPVTKFRCSYDYWKPGPLGATYKSPATNCSTNLIVVLSDGLPTLTVGGIAGIESMIGTACVFDPSAPNGKCGPELVRFLANNDLPGKPGTRVSTYTIGFNADPAGVAYLQTLATEGGGQYYQASDAANLTAAFASIINNVSAEAETFVGLSTTTQPSTISSSPRVFMNLFKPDDKRSWSGNTKGYFASSTGLKDLNNVLATEIDGNQTKFKASAQSFWSAAADGNDVEAGGISAKLTGGSRTIYTYDDPAAPNNSGLTLLTDAGLEPALFGVADNTARDAVVTWLDTAPMADALHSKPVMISYPGKDVLFTMTNQGLLHAVDVTDNTAGGNEIFAFAPQALLPQLKDQQTNGVSTNNHLYGLDGAISYWHDDTDNDHIVDAGEKILLYFGMRRGGNHYYALDVTDLQTGTTPDLEWRIDGGAGNFAQLGQT